MIERRDYIASLVELHILFPVRVYVRYPFSRLPTDRRPHATYVPYK
jgi:hypothetical protein